MSDARLRSPRCERVATGIVVTPGSGLDLLSYRDRCRAVSMSLGPNRFLSRRSAAAVLRIPAPHPPRGYVEVGVYAPGRAPRRKGLIGHRVRAGLLTLQQWDGVVIPHAADVWCQLSAVLPYPDLVAAGDSIISGRLLLSSGGRRRAPLATPEQLRDAHLRHRGGRGTPLRNAALDALRSPVDSPQESRLRLQVISAGFPEPVVNHPVAIGTRTLHVDLAYPELQIAIEYEGAHHFTDPKQALLDLHRLEALHRAGWRVLRVTAEDLRWPEALFERLSDAFAAAIARLTR